MSILLCGEEEVAGGLGGGRHFLWHINCIIFAWQCWPHSDLFHETCGDVNSKHFDYLNVLRCHKTKQGRKILIIKICCCQKDCILKQRFCNVQNPHSVSISQDLTMLKRECFKVEPVLSPLVRSSSWFIVLKNVCVQLNSRFFCVNLKVKF